MKFLKNEKGEFTVEATIVFFISFVTLIVMTYIGIVMYQHVHLQSITDRIASRGAMMYATRTTSMKDGKKELGDFWNSDPYRYIYDGSYKSTAESSIKSELAKSIGEGSILTNNAGDSTNAQVKLGIFSRKVEVTGSRKFNVPFIGVFGLNNSIFNLDVKSTAYIMDMPETIRNVDYVCDLIKQNKSAAKAINKVSELKDKLESFISKIGE